MTSQLLAAPSRAPTPAAIDTDIPARLDRLPWSRFHWLLVAALGITWVLDGLECTIVGSIGAVLTAPEADTRLKFTTTELGLSGTLYLAGAIVGAIFFGHLTDRLGRKKLFTVTLLIYLAGAVLSAFAWSFWSFVAFRVIVGMAIGGEYSAINSAIDEFIPARLRGRVDLAINGTFWLGAAAGSLVALVLLDYRLIPAPLGWRLCFGFGAAVSFAMIVARHFVPESPRWLLTHGRRAEADTIMDGIEAEIVRENGGRPLEPVTRRMTVYPGRRIGFAVIARTLLVRYRTRALLGLVLVASQAFFYNGIGFTYPLVLTKFFNVPANVTGAYTLAFAAANFLGPLLLGHFFDTLGRRQMICATYALSALLVIGTEVLFLLGWLGPKTQTLLWAVTFFFASAAASAGYLTVSEVFPLEMRALAIALFYAVGTAVGGLMAPALFGRLIETNRPADLVVGYLIGAALMLLAAGVEWFIGVAAEQKSLEDITAPLTAERG